MNRATAQTLKCLEHHSVSRVAVVGDTVELGVPESEGWRLVIVAALDEHAKPTHTGSQDCNRQKRGARSVERSRAPR